MAVFEICIGFWVLGIVLKSVEVWDCVILCSPNSLLLLIE